MSYTVEFLDRASQQLLGLPRNTQVRLKPHIDALAGDPCPRRARPLHGSLKGRWSLRVGDYRVIYEIQDDVLVILAIAVGARGGVYPESARRG
jgi:mRNA interferase RelE/StbE